MTLEQTTTCPPKDAWLRLIDGQVTEEKAQAMRSHAQGCSHCGPRLGEGEDLVRRVAAPLAGIPGEVAPETKAKLMRRIAEPRAEKTNGPFKLFWGLGLALASAAALAIVPVMRSMRDEGGFTARGHFVGPSLARDVGVTFYAGGTLQRLSNGDSIQSDTPLVTAYRSLATKQAYLLAVAVDASGKVHWVQPGPDASLALRLDPTSKEQPLPETVVLDEPTPGLLRLMTILSSIPIAPRSLREVPSVQLTKEGLTERFSAQGAVVDELDVTVARE